MIQHLRFYSTLESAQTHLSLQKQTLHNYLRQNFGPEMFTVQVDTNQKASEKIIYTKHTLYSILQREKTASPLEQNCKGSGVGQWSCVPL